jgi:uncharacterized protein (TIGR02246 family)
LLKTSRQDGRLAYNNGDAAKVADLYMQNAVWVRPNEIDRGKAEIEKAVASLMKQFPKLTVDVAGVGQHADSPSAGRDALGGSRPRRHRIVIGVGRM